MNNKTRRIREFFTNITEKVLPICLQYREGYKSMNVSQKKDTTLLTDADIEIQSIIVKHIQDFEPNSYIIAEEDGNIENPLLETASSVWIIDPIDGTAQFANIESREYCVSLCKYERGVPVAALIFMPQLGVNFSPIIAEAFCEEGLIFINGTVYDYSKCKSTRQISCTRSKGSEPHIFEDALIREGYILKTSTTSQSIDLLRTACDLNGFSDLPLPRFDCFFRKKQKIWDGAPGFCFNHIVGNSIITKEFKNLLPLNNSFLSVNAPINDEIYVGQAIIIEKLIRKK